MYIIIQAKKDKKYILGISLDIWLFILMALFRSVAALVLLALFYDGSLIFLSIGRSM